MMYDKSRDKSHFIFALFFFWSANFRPQNVPRNILHHCNGLNIRNIEYFSIFCIVKYPSGQIRSVEEPDGIRLFLRAGEQCKRSGDCDKRACFFHFHSYFSFARTAGVIDFYSTEKLPCRPSCPPASNALRNGRRTRPLRNKPALADRNASHV